MTSASAPDPAATPTAGDRRCFGDGDPVLAAYHDSEWGRPVLSEQGLFERVCLEGLQAGLSWRLILGRRDALRAAFDGFDPDRLAAWDDARLDAALQAPGALRNPRKIAAMRGNALATLSLRETGGLTALVRAHHPPARPAPHTRADVPSTSPESVALAAALRRAGVRFVGPTTAYALLQATGAVDDHLADCPVRAAVEAERAAAWPEPS
ncbi:MAG TPA: DNA-3-methyladenine glycosylase I [Frankiaceae bacterium]